MNLVSGIILIYKYNIQTYYNIALKIRIIKLIFDHAIKDGCHLLAGVITRQQVHCCVDKIDGIQGGKGQLIDNI